MKSIKNNFEYPAILSYFFMFFCFALFNCLDANNNPYSTALLFAFSAIGANSFFAPIIYLCSFFMVGQTGLIASAGIVATINFICTLIYRKSNCVKPYFFVLYCVFSMIGYVFIGNTIKQTDFVEKTAKGNFLFGNKSTHAETGIVSYAE